MSFRKLFKPQRMYICLFRTYVCLLPTRYRLNFIFFFHYFGRVGTCPLGFSDTLSIGTESNSHAAIKISTLSTFYLRVVGKRSLRLLNMVFTETICIINECISHSDGLGNCPHQSDTANNDNTPKRNRVCHLVI